MSTPYERFREALRKTKGQWTLVEWGKNSGQFRIRSTDYERFCPLEGAAGICIYGKFEEAGNFFGLDASLRHKIMNAADAFENYDQQIRQDLLSDCGLEESK